MNYVYDSFERGLWTVGYYRPDGKFVPESDHHAREEAAARVHYLNGGCRELKYDRESVNRFADEHHFDAEERGLKEDEGYAGL